MNTKFNKIMSVLAIVAIVASSFVWAVPVAASTAGDSQWAVQDLPGTTNNVLLPGSSINGIAAGPDGKTVYVIDTVLAPDTIKAVVTAAPWSAAAGTYSLTYTNQGGTPSHTTVNFIIPANSAAGTVIAISLPTTPTTPVTGAGDTMVSAITGVTVVAAAGAADAFKVVGATTGVTFATVTNGATAAGTTFAAGTAQILKSTDGGQSFTTAMGSGTSAYAGGVPVAISVAPDDVNTIAVADASTVWISKDGGTTWASLGSPNLDATLGGGANGVITDVAVAPARSGTLLGREYIVAIADKTAAFADGDVQICGGTSATFTTVGGGAPNTIAGVFDFTSVVVTPNFLGDRCVVAIGTAGAGSTAMLIINTSTNTVVVGSGTPVTGVPLYTIGAGTTTNYITSPAATSIMSSSIALPTNFDPTTSSGRRAYAGIASNNAQNDNDVYRVDDTGATKLGAVTNAPVFSVAYSGTTDTGILFMGPKNNADVKYTTGMTASSPTWTTTMKDPSGPATGAQNVLLVVSPDYATSSKIFCGTTGPESALSVSTDAGYSFNGKSLINCGAANTGNPVAAFTGDGKTMFFYCVDADLYLVLWKSPTPITTTSWTRVFAKQLYNIVPDTSASATRDSGSLKLNPGWTTTPALCLFESSNGVTTNTPIYVSQDGGTTFTTRNGPSGVGYRTGIMRDAQTVYFIDYGSVANIYKSTNAGWTWTTAVSCAVGVVPSAGGIIVPAANQVIVAGTQGVTISNDDGATFNAITGGLPTTDTSAATAAGVTPAIAANTPSWSIVADTNYSKSPLIYAVDLRNKPGSAYQVQLYRVHTDNTSNVWETLTSTVTVAANTVIYNATTRSGFLYIVTNDPLTGVMRSLYPADLVGNQNWTALYIGLPKGIAGTITTTAGINIYGRIDQSYYAINDVLAATKPTLTLPSDNYADSINPTGGNGYAVDLKWSPMGSGSSQVDKVDVEIVDKANGFTGNPSTSAPVTVSPTNPIVNTGNSAFGSQGFILQPNHTYQWRVRAAHTTSGQAYDGVWSDPRTITVQSGGAVQQAYAGVVILGPTGGASNLDPNLVGFAWAPVSGATEYTITVATDATLSKPVSGTPAKLTGSAYQATGLAYGTTYFWQVQATQPTVGIATISTFTTMAKPVAQPTGTAAIQPVQTIVVNPTGSAETPVYIWAVIAIGAILVIAVIILIVRTRRVP